MAAPSPSSDETTNEVRGNDEAYFRSALIWRSVSDEVSCSFFEGRLDLNEWGMRTVSLRKDMVDTLLNPFRTFAREYERLDRERAAKNRKYEDGPVNSCGL